VQRLLTVKEAAELLACSEAAVRKWIYQQRLPKVKVGRLTRLRQSDVEALVNGGLANRLPLKGSQRPQEAPGATIPRCA